MRFKRLEQFGAAAVCAAFLLAISAPFFTPGPAWVAADSAGPDIVLNEPGATTDEGEPKLIALTFDDGPRRSTTTRLLDGLAERGVRATFFLVGQNVEVNQSLVERMEEEGHQIGIHTYDHEGRLTGLSRADFDAQVGRTRALLEDILGHNSFVLRPPYGMTDAGVKAWAEAPIILWSIDPEDWKDQNADRETDLIVQEARDGAIILMHDIYDASVDAALRVVDALHAQGYLFVTVDELYAQRQTELENGAVYWNAYP